MNFRESNVTAALPTRIKRNRQERGRYVAEDIIAYIRQHPRGVLEFEGDFGKIRIGIRPRHLIFANDPRCCFCTMRIELVIVERNPNNPQEKWGIHFYGVKNNELVLFTVDHVVPRSVGGEDHAKNYQSACEECNTKKGNIVTDPFAAAQIRHRGRHG